MAIKNRSANISNLELDADIDNLPVTSSLHQQFLPNVYPQTMTKAYNPTKCCNSTPLHIFTGLLSILKLTVFLEAYGVDLNGRC